MRSVQVEYQVYEIEKFFSESECSDLIVRCEEEGLEKAKVNAISGHQIINEEIRNNDRLIFEDLNLAKDIWQRIKDDIVKVCGTRIACGINERFRFYKYDKGQEFKRHTDGKFVRNSNERSEYTLLIYLNENMTGGETEFTKIKVKPKTGKAIFFKHERRHSGNLIESGVKYVLRSDIMYKRIAE